MTINLNGFGATRAVWRAERIMHVRAFAFPGTARLRRVGLKPVPNTLLNHGGMTTPDWVSWVTAFRILAWDGAKWRVVCEKRGLPRPKSKLPVWFDLAGLETTGLQAEVIECAAEGGWT